MANEKIIEARRERLRHARGRAAGAKAWIAVLKLHAATAWLVRRLNENAVRICVIPRATHHTFSGVKGKHAYVYI